MAHTIVMGCQWGDEGKGRLVDLLSASHDMVVRFQGGANAGHTVIVQGRTFVLHLVPSGILTAGVDNVIGNGCVVDMTALRSEIDELRGAGIDLSPRNLHVSSAAHLVTPVHKVIDAAHGEAIGTTGRGIGPCYMDKVARSGIRLESLVDGTVLSRYRAQLAAWRSREPSLADDETLDSPQVLADMQETAQLVAPYVTDTPALIHAAHQTGRHILFEGAQGAMLDVDHGTYPFVTSSSTTIGAAYSGSGVFLPLDRRIAVLKAYTTRVGHGPFPTELTGALGAELRERGREFGATTKRPRRCGWLDLFQVRQTAMANGYSEIAVTKLDVLRGTSPLRVATAYSADGTVRYQEFEGWDTDITSASTYAQLPDASRSYLAFIESYLQLPVTMVSTGPERSQLLHRDREDSSL
jgi:adenylosuccinate synthase